MRDVPISRIGDEPLDPAAHLAAVEDPEIGAVASFVGTVRDRDPDAAGRVTALEYSAHPDAAATLHAIAVAAIGSARARVAVSHRIGRLAVGEIAVVVAVGAPHRDTAFTICRDVIEAIKTDLPIWKRQIEADGTASWKGLGG